jgi:hypothetical protein
MSDDRIFKDTTEKAVEGLRYACLRPPGIYIDDLNVGLLAIEAARRLGVPPEKSAPVVCGLLADMIEQQIQRAARFRDYRVCDDIDHRAAREAENRRGQISLLRNEAKLQQAA